MPGSVHGALRDAGVLTADPLTGFNEQAYRWVALCNWTYTATLVVSPAMLVDAAAVELRMENVDTFAAVSLNGEVVANLDNSFKRHVVPLVNVPSSSSSSSSASPLRAGPNILRVRFESALTRAAAAAAAYAYPAGPDTTLAHFFKLKFRLL